MSQAEIRSAQLLPLKMVMKKTLKLLNFVITVAGASMIFYAWGMYRLWHAGRHPPPFQIPPSPNPIVVGDWSWRDSNQSWSGATWSNQVVVKQPQAWFILAVLCAGIVTCLTSSAGHIAAETSNSKMLACYCASLGVVIVLQSILAGFLIFDVNWHDALPYDPTGELDTLQAFVNDHFQLCKNLAWSFIALEGQCIFLALRILVDGDDSRESENQDSTDSESALQEPLLHNRVDVSIPEPSITLASSSQKPPRISLSSMADSKVPQYEGCIQPWRYLKHDATHLDHGEIQPERTTPSLMSSTGTGQELSGMMGAMTVERHSMSKGKAVTSPSSSNNLHLWDNGEEGSSLSGISWADLFVDAGEEEYCPPCTDEDGSQDNEFQV